MGSGGATGPTRQVATEEHSAARYCKSGAALPYKQGKRLCLLLLNSTVLGREGLLLLQVGHAGSTVAIYKHDEWYVKQAKCALCLSSPQRRHGILFHLLLQLLS